MRRQTWSSSYLRVCDLFGRAPSGSLDLAAVESSFKKSKQKTGEFGTVNKSGFVALPFLDQPRQRFAGTSFWVTRTRAARQITVYRKFPKTEKKRRLGATSAKGAFEGTSVPGCCRVTPIAGPVTGQNSAFHCSGQLQRIPTGTWQRWKEGAERNAGCGPRLTVGEDSIENGKERLLQMAPREETPCPAQRRRQIVRGCGGGELYGKSTTDTGIRLETTGSLPGRTTPSYFFH